MRFFLLLISLISTTVSAQVNHDSLHGIWLDDSKHDTIRLDALQDLAYSGYLFSQPEIASEYADTMYEFAKKRDLQSFVAKALNIKGISSYFRTNYDDALEHYTEALEIRKKLPNTEAGVASLLNNIAVVYLDQGHYGKSIKYMTESLIIEESIGNRKGVASCLGNIGIVYKEQGE